MHLFHSEFLWTIYCVTGTVLGYWNTFVSKKSLLDLEKDNQ